MPADLPPGVEPNDGTGPHLSISPADAAVIAAAVLEKIAAQSTHSGIEFASVVSVRIAEGQVTYADIHVDGDTEANVITAASLAPGLALYQGLRVAIQWVNPHGCYIIGPATGAPTPLGRISLRCDSGTTEPCIVENGTFGHVVCFGGDLGGEATFSVDIPAGTWPVTLSIIWLPDAGDSPTGTLAGSYTITPDSISDSGTGNESLVIIGPTDQTFVTGGTYSVTVDASGISSDFVSGEFAYTFHVGEEGCEGGGGGG